MPRRSNARKINFTKASLARLRPPDDDGSRMRSIRSNEVSTPTSPPLFATRILAGLRIRREIARLFRLMFAVSS